MKSTEHITKGSRTLYKRTIELPPITKKNSQQILISRKNGRPFIAQSQAYRRYAKQAMWFLTNPPHIDCPVNIRMIFYMPTRRIVDLSNLQSACLDILVSAGVVDDDNSRIVVSHDGSRVLYDRINPRAEIIITEADIRNGETDAD